MSEELVKHNHVALAPAQLPMLQLLRRIKSFQVSGLLIHLEDN